MRAADGGVQSKDITFRNEAWHDATLTRRSSAPMGTLSFGVNKNRTGNPMAVLAEIFRYFLIQIVMIFLLFAWQGCHAIFLLVSSTEPF